MNFLCVCYYDVQTFVGFSESDLERLREICDPHDEEFKASGNVRMIGSLALPDEFRTMRADADGVTVVDGPYAKTREPFGAFFIIEAEDIDEAERVARLHPGTHLGHVMKGGIEIRPIRALQQLEARS